MIVIIDISQRFTYVELSFGSCPRFARLLLHPRSMHFDLNIGGFLHLAQQRVGVGHEDGCGHLHLTVSGKHLADSIVYHFG